ncbi:MAG TPA: quinone-dependent dihydroorotate dehydrogenase [Nitrolancea sp.]|nr:quinone-dependent dihydroorotate dehydrogenase [Nitrolancea sp.]
MAAFYRSLAYPILARIEPERAHHLGLRLLQLSGRLPGGVGLLGRFAGPDDDRLRVHRFGISFANPVGVAAGLDKNAEAVPALLALGFGSVEVGTVTRRPQPGNARPRIWRLADEGALINSLGFPSDGAARVRTRLAARRYSGVVGINLGKNRDTPLEAAAEDYVAVLEALWDVANYVAINVSSPNTPGLRGLQQREALAAILRAVQDINRRCARLHKGMPRPVLVKIAPDLDDQELEGVLAGAVDGGAGGLIVANTTTDRSNLSQPVPDFRGGLSGRPLRERATTLVREVHRRCGDSLPIIGVGGISNAEDVIERMRDGASLVQLYTAFIYGGPALPGRICRELLSFIEREGLRSIEEIIGASAKS